MILDDTNKIRNQYSTFQTHVAFVYIKSFWNSNIPDDNFGNKKAYNVILYY